jgi:hypothetical protein
LYNISGGELGNEVSAVEKKLKEIFKVGWRWKALVLLDEADVLMVKRSSHELARSAIVAGRYGKRDIHYVLTKHQCFFE